MCSLNTAQALCELLDKQLTAAAASSHWVLFWVTMQMTANNTRATLGQQTLGAMQIGWSQTVVRFKTMHAKSWQIPLARALAH